MFFFWLYNHYQFSDIHDQFKLLQGYAWKLDLGFEYGEACDARNARLIKDFHQDYSSLYRGFANTCLVFLTILNVILHIVFYPYIGIKEMGHMFSTVHEPSYFFDAIIKRWRKRIDRPHRFMEVASDAMLRYLAKGMAD